MLGEQTNACKANKHQLISVKMFLKQGKEEKKPSTFPDVFLKFLFSPIYNQWRLLGVSR